MMKKSLSMFLTAFLLLACSLTAFADEGYPYHGHWGLDTTRSVIFASDGGTYIRPVEVQKGTVLNLDNYIPVKARYVFDGWYADPRTKQQKVTEITLEENIVVYAKWLGNGSPKQAERPRVYASNTEVMQFGDYVDEKTGVPVTALWVQQQAKLQALMEQYYQKFNQ